MKRTTIRLAILSAFLCTGTRAVATLPGAPAAESPMREIAADSLQQLCAGRLPIYACGDEIWMAIPDFEISLTVQIDRGAGLRSRLLKSLPPFRLTADRKAGLAHMTFTDTLSTAGFGAPALPLARIEGSDRLLAGIDKGLFQTGQWYDCSGWLLRSQRYGTEELLDVEASPHGTLLRLKVWYDIEAPERSTEIQMSSGALPLEIGICLSDATSTRSVPEREIAVSDLLPGAYAEALEEAVATYNRMHRKRPLRLVPGGEYAPLTVPYAVAYDGATERLATEIRRADTTEAPTWLRIHLGTADLREEALKHALRDESSRRELYRRLADPQRCRRIYLHENLLNALNEAFDPIGAAIASLSPTESVARAFRRARRQTARWERFMRKESHPAAGTAMEDTEVLLYRAMLAQTQHIYIQLAAASRGEDLQRTVLDWVARGLIADAEGRYATERLRRNALTMNGRETELRQSAVWRSVLDSCTPESLNGMAERFLRTLQQYGPAAYGMQASFVEALLKSLAEHPEFTTAAASLETLYGRLAESDDPQTEDHGRAVFARIERERLRTIRNNEH